MKTKSIKTYNDLLALREEYREAANAKLGVILQPGKLVERNSRSTQLGRFRKFSGYIEPLLAISNGIVFGIKIMRNAKQLFRSFKRH